jgi:hypothetical protein
MPFVLLEADECLDTMFKGGFEYYSPHTTGFTAIKLWIVKVKSFVDNYIPLPPSSAITISSTMQPLEPAALAT